MKKGWIFILIGCMIFNISAMSQKTTKEKVTKFVIHTSYGDMKGYLYNETPQHRDNFAKLVKEGFFNDLLFHRVISGFMIQGGDPNSRNAKPGIALGSGGPGYTVPAEFNNTLIHKKGALAAARQADEVNPKKASSGSQFYIVQGKTYSEGQLNGMASQMGLTYTNAQKEAYATLGGTPFLDMNYTVFGEITDGLDVIDKISAVQKGAGDRPVQDLKMTVELID
ncbi:MAG: peptidylprolyl isomerase [Bacteroidales bacterium]|nr:peptidylprolyl isomerase [Bacteroidales bacterium]